MARHNRALVALARGDLPQALAYFDEAETRYDELGETNPDLAIDRGRTLLAAGLAAEAVRETDAALGRMPPGGGIPYKTAELVFVAATAALAASDPAAAQQRARRAGQLFRAQGRDVWAARAGLFWPRPGMRPVSVRRACSGRLSSSPRSSTRPGPARDCRPTCWPGRSRWPGVRPWTPTGTWSRPPGPAAGGHR